MLILTDPVGGDGSAPQNLTTDAGKAIFKATSAHCRSSPNSIRPKGYAISIDKESTVTLPTKLKEKPTHLYFRVLGCPFAIMLSDYPSSQKSMNWLTIYITGGHSGEGLIFKMAPQDKKIVTSKKMWLSRTDNFNRGCDHNVYTYYHVFFSPKENTLLIEHSGSTSIHNSLQLCYKDDISPNLRYINFYAPKKPISIKNVEITDVEMDAVLTGKIPPKAIPLNTPSNTSVGIIRHITNKIGITSTVCDKGWKCQSVLDKDHMKKYEHPFTPCPDGIIDCPKKFLDKAHDKKYAHICRFNTGCNHPMQCGFLHVPHEECGHNDCNSLDDPKHRESYYHRNYPDYLMVCKRSASTCKDVNDPQHYRLYKHY